MQEILLRTACLNYPSRVGALRGVLRHAYLAVFIRRMKGQLSGSWLCRLAVGSMSGSMCQKPMRNLWWNMSDASVGVLALYIGHTECMSGRCMPAASIAGFVGLLHRTASLSAHTGTGKRGVAA